MVGPGTGPGLKSFGAEVEWEPEKLTPATSGANIAGFQLY